MSKNKIAFLLSLFLLIPALAYSGDLQDLADKLGKDLQDSKTSIAVMDFPTSEGGSSQDSVVIRERLTTYFTQNKNLTLVERALLDKVLQEQKLQASGAVSPDTAKEIGKLLGVGALVSGTIHELANDKVELHARIIEVETGKILYAGQATLKRDWKYFKPLNLDLSEKVSPDSAQDYYRRGVQFQADGKYGMALECFSRAIKIKPDFLEAYYNRGTLNALKGLFSEATVDFTQALEIKVDFGAGYIGRALAYHALYEYDRALSDLDKAIELVADNADAYFYRGLVYDNSGKHNEAIADYTRAVEISPRYEYAYLNRGNVRLMIGENEKAIADYSKVIEISPNNSDAYSRRGSAHERLGDYMKAIEDSKAALAKNQDDDLAFVNLINVYRRKREYDKVISECTAFIQRKINGPYNLFDAYYSRGDAYVNLGKYDRALKDCEAIIAGKYLEKSGEMASVLFYELRGQIYSQKKEFSKAIQDFTKAIESGHATWFSYRKRAEAYHAIGKNEEAAADLKIALEQNPKLKEHVHGLAASLRRMGYLP